MKQIAAYTLNCFEAAHKENLRIHDRDIASFAVEKANEIQVDFKVSDAWVVKFKKAYSIVDRAITKVITQNHKQVEDDAQKRGDDFVQDFHRKYPDINPALIVNTDQSGFRHEPHAHRTLALKGARKINAIAIDINATTHSYTIQPEITADGKLRSPMLIVLQETSKSLNTTRGFGPQVWQGLQSCITLYDNLYIWGSTSGKCTNPITKDWFKEVFFKHSENGTVLLADSFSCFKVRAQLESPIEYNVETIPEKTTGFIQPADVYFFRPYKNFVKEVIDRAGLHRMHLKFSEREEIFKVQSLAHWIFSSPLFIPMIKFAFFSPGFISDRPGKCETPKDYCFPKHMLNCQTCNQKGFIRCSHCHQYFCFGHFYFMYHRLQCINK